MKTLVFLKVVPDLVCFKSGRSRTWLDLEFKYGWSKSWIWEEFVLGSENNTPDETNGVNNAVSCYKEAVQFSASFVTSLFACFLTKFVEQQ